MGARRNCQGSNYIQLEGEKTPPSNVTAERSGQLDILGIRKRWMVEHWNRLPRDMVMVPSLSEFK